MPGRSASHRWQHPPQQLEDTKPPQHHPSLTQGPLHDRCGRPTARGRQTRRTAHVQALREAQGLRASAASPPCFPHPARNHFYQIQPPCHGTCVHQQSEWRDVPACCEPQQARRMLRNNGGQICNPCLMNTHCHTAPSLHSKLARRDTCCHLSPTCWDHLCTALSATRRATIVSLGRVLPWVCGNQCPRAHNMVS